VFWLGASLPILNWLSFSLIASAEIPARELNGEWLLFFLACSFVIGAGNDLRGLFRGLSASLSLSSLIAVAQWMGWVSIDSYNFPAGLLYNSAIHACAISLVITALACAGDWRFMPLMVPGLVIAQSRGAYLVLLAALIGRIFGWRGAVLAVLAAACVLLTFVGVSDADRLLFWAVAWQQLEWLGHGPGEFSNMVFNVGGVIHYPGHVHNDYLQLAYELGVFAAPIYLVYAVALTRTRSKYWLPFVGFATSSLFFFPFYNGVTGLIGATLAGHLIYHDRMQRISRDAPAMEVR